MSNPLYACPTVVRADAARAGALSRAHGFRLGGGTLSYRAAHRPDRPPAGGVRRSGLGRGDPRRDSHRQPRRDLVRRRRRAHCRGCITWLHPLGSLADQLVQIEDAEARRWSSTARLSASAAASSRRARRACDDLHARPGRLRPRPAGGGAKRPAARTARDLAGPDDIAMLNYTGGTTGKSKGALRHHRELRLSPPRSSPISKFRTRRAISRSAPISHVAGTKVLPTLMRGGTVHLLKGFDPEAVLETIARERINFTLLVPTMIYVLLDHPDARPDRPLVARTAALRRLADVADAAGRGAGAHRPGVLAALRPDRVLPGVGAAQGRSRSARGRSCSPPAASRSPRARCDPRRRRPGSGAGEAGEICVRAGRTSMEEYWKRPEQTAETFKGGWLHTGDIARADERGYLYIVDRKKDMIVSGGFNIFPREVEDVLSPHPDVAMAAVIGVPDEKWGEAVAAHGRRASPARSRRRRRSSSS